MSKDELRFISDLAEKHQINFNQLMIILGVGATRSAAIFNMQQRYDLETKMVNLETDLARCVGIIPLAEIIEGSDDFE